MKTIFIYFSYSGNNDYIAHHLKDIINCDILKLETVEPYSPVRFKTMFKGGMEAVRGMKPKLKPYSVDFDRYDVLIFGTPVWAWTIAPAMQSFISENELVSSKKVIFTCTHGGKAGHTLDRFKELLPNNEILFSHEIKEPLQNKESADKVIQQIADALR